MTIDGSTIIITAEGTYILSGTLTDGTIVVDTDDSAKVQIVLNGAEITSSDSAALYVKQADKVFVTTASGTQNTLANGGTFASDADSDIDAAVYARDDITFNGSGSLTITSPAGHGIAGNDDVKFGGGTYMIEAAKHGVKAHESARFAESDVTIKAGTDGVHVSGGEDESGKESESFFYIADGSLTISAGDDGIHADAESLIEGGSIDVEESYEGIEALAIKVSGGEVDVTASDDGLNAAGGNSGSSGQTFGEDDWFGGQGGGFNDGGTDGSIEISGGTIHIQAAGDGVDANGSVTISGGYTVVEGPSQGDTSVLDYNSEGTITGGTFIGTGGAGMAENFSSAENQGVIAVSVGSQSAGTTVTLTDTDGNTLAEVTPELDYAVVYVSTPEMKQGETYTLTAGTYSEQIELTELMYSTLSGGMGGRGGAPVMGGSDGGSMNRGPHGNSGMRGVPGSSNDSGSTDAVTGPTGLDRQDETAV